MPQALIFSLTGATLIDFGPLKFLRHHRQGRYPYCHSLLLAGPELTLIDPSADKGRFQQWAAAGAVGQIFLSHYHEDHRKYLYLFPQARIWVPQAEIAAYRSLEQLQACMGLAAGLYRQYFHEVIVPAFRLKPLAAPHGFQEGEEFRLGRVRLVIWETPGHTPGHSCFYFPDQDIIYLADLDLTPFGPWYGDAVSDLEAFWQSLARLEACPAKIYLTAHGNGIFTAAAARAALQGYRQVILAREAELLRRLVRPLTLEELVANRLIYRPELRPVFVYEHLERQMVRHHLTWLAKRGLIQCREDGYVAA